MSIRPGLYPTHNRPPLSGRILELLENLKNEFESLSHEVTVNKHQKEELDRKIQAQINETSNIQSTLYELERAHIKLKQQYEEEALRLKRQAELQGHSSSPSSFHSSTANLEPTRSISNEKGMFFGSGLAPIIDNSKLNYPTLPAKRPRSETDMGLFSGPSLPSLTGITDMVSKQPKTDNSSYSVNSSIFRERESRKDTPLPRGIGGSTAVPFEEKSPLTPNKDIIPNKQSIDLKKKEEEKNYEYYSDWHVGNIHNGPSPLKIDLFHTFEHQSVVCSVKFSHDGKLLATGCNRSAQLFDVETGEKIKCFFDENAKEGDLYIRSVCFSPDGKYLAAGAEDKTVKIWDIERNTTFQVLQGHEQELYSLDYSSNGNIIVSGSGDRKVKLWELESGKCLYTLGNDEVGPHDGVTSVALSPDGRYIAAGSLDHFVRLWDASTGQLLERYEGHSDSVYSVAFSPDGKSLASGSLDKTLKLWDLQGPRSRPRSSFQGHNDFVLSVAFSREGDWLVSGSKDRTVLFWDPRGPNTPHMVLQGHKNSVISVAMNPHSTLFATGSGDFRVRVWHYKYPLFCVTMFL